MSKVEHWAWPMLILEFSGSGEGGSYLVGWDEVPPAWCTTLDGPLSQQIVVLTLTPCQFTTEGMTTESLAQRLVAFAHETRRYLISVRGATVPASARSDTLQRTVLIHSATSSHPRPRLGALGKVIEELERADMSEADRRLFNGRPTGGIGF